MAALVSLWPLCTAEFTNWDDNWTVSQNPTLNPPTLQSLRIWWTSANLDLWDPVTDMARGALALVAITPSPDPITGSRLNPYVFHSANLLIHIATALIVFQSLKLLLVHVSGAGMSSYESGNKANGLKPRPGTTPVKWAACAGAILFAVHPLQVESVGWVTAMKDLLCGLFSLAAIWRYLIYAGGTNVWPVLAAGEHRREAPARKEFWIATFLFVLATLSKPTAVVVPFMLLAVNWLILRQPPQKIWRGILFWMILSLPCIIVTKCVQGASHIEYVALWKRPLVAADALAFYLYKLAWPLRLGWDYGRTPAWIFQYHYAWWTWSVPAAVAVLLFIARRRAPMVLSGAIIILLGLLPVIGLVPFDFQQFSTVSDHYLYLSMFGVAMAFAWALAQLSARAAFACALVLLGAFSARAWVHTWTWESSQSLYVHALSVNPRSFAANGNLANLNLAENRLGMAEQYAREALGINPRYASMYAVLGNVFRREHRMAEAAQVYRAAIAIDPKSADAARELGYVLSIQGHWSQATEYLRRATELDPDSARDHRDLALALAINNETDAAIDEFRKALALSPDNAQIHAQFAKVLAKVGRREDAGREDEIARRLDPSLKLDPAPDIGYSSDPAPPPK